MKDSATIALIYSSVCRNLIENKDFKDTRYFGLTRLFIFRYIVFS